MQDILEHLLLNGALDEAEAGRAFALILTGQANESQVGAMLALIASRGATLDEIVGGARVMRGHVTPVPIAPDDAVRASLIDTCGTGGTPKTFNVSTCAAVVAASAAPGRVFVAKHGGRSRSGRGSAEVLASLGVNIDATPEVQAACLREIGVCFSFAVNHHPAMKFAAGPRKSLGFPTVFNLLGPLCNPAGAKRQVMGVYGRRYVALIAEALHRLGAERALVVHADDGMDEISTTANTTVAEVTPGGVTVSEFDARSVGLRRASLDDLRVATLDDAAALFRSVLAGKAGPATDIVALNAGAALMVGGAAPTIGEGLALAQQAIASGAAQRTLERLVERSRA